jgi:hypothetical protein
MLRASRFRVTAKLPDYLFFCGSLNDGMFSFRGGSFGWNFGVSIFGVSIFGRVGSFVFSLSQPRPVRISPGGQITGSDDFTQTPSALRSSPDWQGAFG